MARKKGTLNMGNNLEALVDAPLDPREVVPLKADLTDPDSFPYFYLGMQVFVTEEMKRYTLVGDDPTNIASWKVESLGGGGSDIQAALEVTENVGGIPAGSLYAAGEEVEKILRDLLNPLKNPAFTPPSASLAITTGSSLQEKGATAAITFTLSLNRGKIDPPYGTSGYRSGAATEYSLNSSTPQSGNVFNVTDVSETNATFQGTIYYGEGEQPKDSHGQNYENPLVAGSVNSNTISIEFVDAIWSNAADITTIAKEPLISKSAKSKQFVFPPCTKVNPEVFDIPESWNVSKVEVLSELSGKFEDCTSEFTPTTATTHNDAAGNPVNYKRYTDNRGYASGSRTIKVTWS